MFPSGILLNLAAGYRRLKYFPLNDMSKRGKITNDTPHAKILTIQIRMRTKNANEYRVVKNDRSAFAIWC